jgi:hypothetical protein
MTFARASKSLLVVGALLLASSAFAATKANLQLSHAVTVNGTQLKAGEYKVQWDGSGPDVEVSLLQGRNVVAKFPAHVVDLNTTAYSDAAVINKGDDGTSRLAQIRFQGKRFALDLSQSGSGMQASK